MKAANCSGKILKKLLIGLGVVLALGILSAYLFTHFYFRRTLPRQVTGVVVRCSNGILKKSGDQWLPLKAGHRIEPGMRIKTPEGRSILAFSGIRLLAYGPSEIAIRNGHSFAFENGEIVMASGQATGPVGVPIGMRILSTSGSVIRLSKAAHSASFEVDCISGEVNLKNSRGEVEHVINPSSAVQKIGSSPN
jgi:hypothetical protein